MALSRARTFARPKKMPALQATLSSFSYCYYILCTFYSSPKETLSMGKIKYVYIMTGDKPRLESINIHVNE